MAATEDPGVSAPTVGKYVLPLKLGPLRREQRRLAALLQKPGTQKFAIKVTPRKKKESKHYCVCSRVDPEGIYRNPALDHIKEGLFNCGLIRRCVSEPQLNTEEDDEGEIKRGNLTSRSYVNEDRMSSVFDNEIAQVFLSSRDSGAVFADSQISSGFDNVIFCENLEMQRFNDYNSVPYRRPSNPLVSRKKMFLTPNDNDSRFSQDYNVTTPDSTMTYRSPTSRIDNTISVQGIGIDENIEEQSEKSEISETVELPPLIKTPRKSVDNTTPRRSTHDDNSQIDERSQKLLGDLEKRRTEKVDKYLTKLDVDREEHGVTDNVSKRKPKREKAIRPHKTNRPKRTGISSVESVRPRVPSVTTAVAAYSSEPETEGKHPVVPLSARTLGNSDHVCLPRTASADRRTISRSMMGSFSNFSRQDTKLTIGSFDSGSYTCHRAMDDFDEFDDFGIQIHHSKGVNSFPGRLPPSPRKARIEAARNFKPPPPKPRRVNKENMRHIRFEDDIQRGPSQSVDNIDKQAKNNNADDNQKFTMAEESETQDKNPKEQGPMRVVPGEEIGVRKDGTKEAYIKALVAAQSAKFKRNPYYFHDRLTKPFTFSYFDNVYAKVCQDCKQPIVPLSQHNHIRNPMKHIFGKVKVNDYFPGGKKNQVLERLPEE